MLAAAVEGIEGEITAETVNAAIQSMPETDLPAGGGVTFQCGGTAYPDQPAVCTNQWLRSVLDAEGEPTDYTVEDSTDVLG
jgi:branched-chain amino acid transport system substrate-binding protein